MILVTPSLCPSVASAYRIFFDLDLDAKYAADIHDNGSKCKSIDGMNDRPIHVVMD